MYGNSLPGLDAYLTPPEPHEVGLTLTCENCEEENEDLYDVLYGYAVWMCPNCKHRNDTDVADLLWGDDDD